MNIDWQANMLAPDVDRFPYDFVYVACIDPVFAIDQIVNRSNEIGSHEPWKTFGVGNENLRFPLSLPSHKELIVVGPPLHALNRNMDIVILRVEPLHHRRHLVSIATGESIPEAQLDDILVANRSPHGFENIETGNHEVEREENDPAYGQFLKFFESHLASGRVSIVRLGKGIESVKPAVMASLNRALLWGLRLAAKKGATFCVTGVLTRYG